MNRKQRIIISVTGIFIVLLILVGLTYAYFLTRISGNTNTKSISVTTADLKLTYGDGNGDITAEKIEPGTVIDTKTFTVTNEGNATVNNYAVYLEELVNTLSRTSDMVYTLTCTSSVSGKTCNGVNETSFPTQNGMLVTNNIDVKETQSYELKVEYKEMNVDQSEDMNKTISAKVQIYNLSDIVDITGTVTNAATGDYVEMQSTPKTSQITDGKYLIPAVEPGTHTLYVKDSKGTVKGSKQITINKGSTSSVNGDTITVTSDSQTISINITNISSTLTTDIGDVKDYNPFSDGTLASAIYSNSKNKTNGTEFVMTPKTKVSEETSSHKYYTDESTTESSMSISTTYQGYYWTYGTGYTIDENTGVFTLTGVATCKYDDGTCNSTLVGKYLVSDSAYLNSSSTDTKKTTTNLSKIYKVAEAPENSSSIIMKYKKISSASYSLEKELSVAMDDYGTSYYYRGGVEDNYVDFAGMCWRIVRIQGDGSIKLILEDQDSTCANSDGNWNIPTTTGGTVVKGNFGYTSYAANTLTASDGTQNSKTITRMNYLNGETNSDKSMATAFKNFQTGKLTDYLDKLKPGDWCMNDKFYTSKSNNSTPLTSQEILDKLIKKQSYYYYDSYVRLYGKTIKEPMLKCNGTVMTKFNDNESMYVGTLTSDEIVYAGGKAFDSNPSYYLINKYQKNKSLIFLSLSPYANFPFVDGPEDLVFHVYESGSISKTNTNFSVSDVRFSFRPSVILKTDTKITSGDGTKTNAYKVS